MTFSKKPIDDRGRLETPADLGALAQWADGHEHFRGLLYTALAGLSAQGYSTTLDEARDLILDFFLSEWAGLVARYNPARARPHTYVYRAFVLYARPRIRRLQRWKNSLADVAALARQLPDRTALSTAEAPDINSVRLALSRLPTAEREAIDLSLMEGSSLRELAERQGITRYQAREMLCNAFGRVLVGLGERGMLSDLEWQAALKIWRDGKSPREAALELGVSAVDIQACRAKVLDIIGRGIRAANRAATRPLRYQGTTIMPSINIAEMFRNALLKSSNSAWTDIHTHREQILKLLENDDLKLSKEEEHQLEEPETSARLLKALGEELKYYFTPSECESAEALLGAQREDEVLVGTAFMQTLLPGLSENLLKFDRWFLSISVISDAERTYLLSRTDVQAANQAGGYPAGLLKYGITPLTFLYASQAARNVYDDQLRSGQVKQDQAIRLTAGEHATATLPVGDVAREIGMLVECESRMAKAMYDFCFAIALDEHPYFWDGFVAEADGSAALSLAPAERKELAEQWKAYALVS